MSKLKPVTVSESLPLTRHAAAFLATANLPGVAFADMRRMIRKELDEDHIAIPGDTPRRLILCINGGLLGVRLSNADMTVFIVATDDRRKLSAYRADAVEHIGAAFPDVADIIRWSDGDSAGDFPLNFQFLEVKSVAQIGKTFLRVTLQAEDLLGFGVEAIHFIVVLPSQGFEPEWPELAPNGSVNWPTGVAAPHKPAYTARRVEFSANTLAMDVFIHDGGRITVWAKGLIAGTETRTTIGIIGPGGVGMISAEKVLVGSDETGFPPVTRLIDNLLSGACAEVYLEAENGESCGYPMPQREGVVLHWLSRTNGETASEAVINVLDDHKDAVVWVAGERHSAKRVRDVAKGQGRAKCCLRFPKTRNSEAAFGTALTFRDIANALRRMPLACNPNNSILVVIKNVN
ncbi:MAG: siderophore-interacting protein, partial [Pseudomonadota bacterium]